MVMIIKKVDNKFYLFFDETTPQNRCFIGNTRETAQTKARKILKAHNQPITNILYIL